MGEDDKSEIKVAGGSGGRSGLGGDDESGITVQADVISVLIDKMEIITLDLCSSLFPVLVAYSPLTSKMERI
ncbi:hypothetical protein LINPERHAP2_LOCUS29147 [Linum perenne]